MEKIIYGIQQIGVGVPNAVEGFHWYGKVLGSDIKIFDDNNVATYMAPYMGGNPHKKRAILAANIQGGSCYEIWQFMDRIPESPAEEPALGDLGIFAVKVKAKNIHEARQSVIKKGAKVLSDIQLNPDDQPFFFMEDLFGNKIQVIESYEWFKPLKRYTTGGVYGCMIGVSDMERSLTFYKEILGYDMVIYDLTKEFPDLAGLKGGDRKIRRVLLTHSAERRGSMAALLGRSQIELIQVQSASPRKIFEGRYWGDIGFIHLCFDIHGMAALKEECARKGFPFTVESDDAFKMGEAAGHWSYTEDPDGTLIEFVETKKIPLVKKWNLYLNLEKRNPYKPLPRWMIRALSLNRVKM
ncbi:MAG: VOC family protein [Bacteroidales bacterium]|jgi:catechol 2,3-dioxygenase-like lactoylglutathione lyase family enzyme|nr:VOC family protein [Bacteroidales bacterium]